VLISVLNAVDAKIGPKALGPRHRIRIILHNPQDREAERRRPLAWHALRCLT
jgi:hypothetical protein